MIRMFPTPAHDGVRLFLPTFFFLAAFAGWGTIWLADALARTDPVRQWPVRAAVAGPGARPGRPRRSCGSILTSCRITTSSSAARAGPGQRGFELTYWYDAFNDQVLADINRKLPPNAEVDFLNDKTHVRGPGFRSSRAWASCGTTSAWRRATRPISLRLAPDAGFEGDGASRGCCSRCVPGMRAEPRS